MHPGGWDLGRKLGALLLLAGVAGAGLAGGPASPFWLLLPPAALSAALLLPYGIALSLVALAATLLLAGAFATQAPLAPAVVLALAAAGCGLTGAWLQRRAARQRRELLQAAKELRHRERLLRHAARLQTAGDMASMVVHRLRNQLQIAAGHAAIALQSPAEARDERFRGIEAAIVACRASTDELLGLAHPGPIDAEPALVDANDVARRVGAVLTPLLPPSAALHLRLASGPARVRVVERELEDCLVNLVVNAGQAVDGHGRIELSVEAMPDAPVRIVVADDGVGIRPEDLPEIFKPFFTTKERGIGTGLGLAAVERFVAASGGRILVHSEPGHGSMFTLELPPATAVATRSA